MTWRSRFPHRRHLARVPTLWVVVALGLALPAGALGAQSSCVRRRDGERAAPARWAAPLDRLVALHGGEIPLRDALDRIAAAGGIRLSYSGDLLPLDRPVCPAFDSVSLGDALSILLRGTAVAPVVTGVDQVVLTPAPRSAAPEDSTTSRVNVLDRVVVTGSAVAASQRPLTIALDVIPGARLQRRSAGGLADALDAEVPGMWLWQQSPSTLLARYGSIRGASSFGMSYPKIYIDGIAVANPLVVTRLLPGAIDHVEVIRGPQGAALYGADAISGVVNIVTRHDAPDSASGHAALSSDAGLSQTAFAAHGAIVQHHELRLEGGSSVRSAGLTIGGGSMGEFIPGAFSRDLQGVAGARLVGARTSFVATARFYASEAGAAANPLVGGGTAGTIAATRLDERQADAALAPAAVGAGVEADSEPQSVREYTLGGTLRYAQSDRWTHSIVAGVDGFRLNNVAADGVPMPSAVDSALRAAGGGADRATLRASSVARVGGADRAAATLTLAVEHSALREIAPADRDGDARLDAARAAASEITMWRNSTGFIAQSDASFRDALFVTAGARLERDDAVGGGGQFTTLPMVGVAVVRDRGPFTAKLRAAYGRGLRPASLSAREIAWDGMRRAANVPALAPEEQSGVEAGVDLFVGSDFALHATRFDQRAFGLIQPVALADSASSSSAGTRRVSYELQNVGEIGNRGWELQSTARAGHLSLTGALSLVDSRVRRTAPGYTGDLQPGDRMLAVPARTASGVAEWRTSTWSTSVSVSRASNWIDYDRLAIAAAWAGGANPRQFDGAQLRSFWRGYPGVTRLGVSLSRQLTRGFSLLLTGDNLLDQQVGEPDDITIVPGRTLTAGLRASF